MSGTLISGFLTPAVKAAIVPRKLERPGHESRTMARAGSVALPNSGFCPSVLLDLRMSSLSVLSVRQPPLEKACTSRPLEGPAVYPLARARRTSAAGARA